EGGRARPGQPERDHERLAVLDRRREAVAVQRRTQRLAAARDGAERDPARDRRGDGAAVGGEDVDREAAPLGDRSGGVPDQAAAQRLADRLRRRDRLADRQLLAAVAERVL